MTRRGRARRRLALAGMMVVLVLLAVVVGRTALFTSRQVQVAPVRIAVDRDRLADRLAQAIQIRTVSHQDASRGGPPEILELHAFLERTFPQVHAVLSREVVGGGSLVFTWRGQQPTAAPVLLAAHMDVVPVELRAEVDWTHPPFAGRIADGHVWGRGALDDKAGLMGVLEAVEMLLADGYRPRRSFFLAFGHDEELGGAGGAGQIATYLRERGLRPELVLDEGLVIAHGIIPAVTAPVAAVGIAEKGHVTAELAVESAGGHSSMPPRESAIGILGVAIARLEARPMRGRLEGPTRLMFESIGPEMALPRRAVLANLWLFGWLVERQLAAAPSSNALLRTTAAVTLVEGGVKENVLPARARALVHFRVRPGDAIADVLAHAEATIGDRRVRVRQVDRGSEASAASDPGSPAFATLARTIREIFPDVVVAPSLFIGATDSRYYAGLSANIFRFRPLRLGPRDLSRIHGADERIAVENYGQLVQFYVQLIRNSDLGPDSPAPPAR